MRRRAFLGMSALPPLAMAQSAGGKTPTVAKLETFVVKVHRSTWLLVRVTASNGLTGVGDASHGGDERVLPIMKQLFAELQGRSIFDLEWLRLRAEPHIKWTGRPSPGAVALSGLEQCLWDLQGKHLGVPVCDLLGGRLTDRIRNYANINRSTTDRSPAGFARMAESAVAAGFDAIKLAPFDDMPKLSEPETVIEKFTALGIERAAAVRTAIGPKRDLLIDVHSHMDVPRGIVLAKVMEKLDLFWLEEVVPARPDPKGMAAINEAAAMRTAGGESIYGLKNFYPYIAAGAVDITMPDVKYCGGVLELKKIAALSEAAGLPFAPHGPASPVGNMAAAHVCVTQPNALILEFSHGEIPWRAESVLPVESLDKGWLTVSRRPGFGLELNDQVLKKHAV